MKFKSLVLFAAMMMASVSVNAQTDTPLKGDVNGDGKVTITDAIAVVNIILNGGSEEEDNPHAGVEAVDLGLPSGTKWANMNVGASKPEDYGDYFAWGETMPKDTYDWTSYKWCNGSSNTLTKYCTDASYGNNGFTDNKTVLDMEDDAARANWGGDWRMPTKADFDELKANTTNEWTTVNGVYGRKFTSTSNGNSIFLPAAGLRQNDELYYDGLNGDYWSSSLEESSPHDAWDLDFYSGGVFVYGYYRGPGRSVRPVR